MDKIVIVGGGTAGWMTAGYLKHRHPNKEIVLIESPNIPIIGVGESVTPHFHGFLQEMGIDTDHWMLHTGSIYKLANKFVDWTHNQGEVEYFSFNYSLSSDNFYKDITQARSKEELNIATDTMERNIDHMAELCKLGVAKKFDKFFNPQYHYMEKNVSPFINKETVLNAPMSVSLHINAELAGHYIRDFVALPKGVKHIVANVTDIQHTGDNIDLITLDNGTEVTADLFIDCTGLKKILVRKLGWAEKVYEDNPIDRAWVVQTDYTDQESEMVNYTQSIAEPHGWRFKIGLYHRMGNGYCFSSKHVSEEDALAHFKTKLTDTRFEPRLIRWTPSRLEKFGAGNVGTVGLTCGFVEPLEANALYTIITAIRKLNAVVESNSYDFTNFNQSMAYTIDDIADFILVHYTLSSRDDTKFWQDMRNLASKRNDVELVWRKTKEPNNSMRGAVLGMTMFPDYMWLQLAIAWELGSNQTVNPVTLELAKMYYIHSEKKHDYVSDQMINNYKWLNKSIFNSLNSADWEKAYLKRS